MSWDIFVVLLLFWTSLEVPYTLVFIDLVSDGPLPRPMFILNVVIDCFLMIDIVLNFRTGFVDQFDKLHIIADPKQIRRRYLKTWFLLDLVSSFPLEAFLAPFSHSEDETYTELVKVLRIFRFVRAVKILRVLRIIRALKGMTHRIFARRSTMICKVIRCMTYMVMTAHYFACFWFAVGFYTKKRGQDSWLKHITEDHPGGSSSFTNYSYSMYWSVVTLFTTGYGDITAHNEMEQWTASICILIGTCFFAYFVGIFTNLLEEGNKVKMYELERVEEAQMFCSHHKLPRGLTQAIVTHVRYHCNYNYIHSQNELMSFVPAHLQSIVSKLKSHSFAHLDLFQKLPNEVIGQIALRMTSVSCNRGYVLFEKDEISHILYVQRTGTAELIRNGKKIRDLRRGDMCGEYVILSGQHRETVSCLSFCEFYALDCHDLLDVLRTYYHVPKEFHKQHNYIKEVLRKTLNQPPRRRAKFDKLAEEHYVHELLATEQMGSVMVPPSRENSNVFLTANNRRAQRLPASEELAEEGTIPMAHSPEEVDGAENRDGDGPAIGAVSQALSTILVRSSGSSDSATTPRSGSAGTVRSSGSAAFPDRNARTSRSQRILKKFAMPFLHSQNSISRDRKVTIRTTELQDVKPVEEEDVTYSDAEDSQYYSMRRGASAQDVLVGTMRQQTKSAATRRGHGVRGGKFGGKRSGAAKRTTSRSKKSSPSPVSTKPTQVAVRSSAASRHQGDDMKTPSEAVDGVDAFGSDIAAECQKLIRPLINRYADHGEEIEISVHLVQRSTRRALLKRTFSGFDPRDRDISVVADLVEEFSNTPSSNQIAPPPADEENELKTQTFRMKAVPNLKHSEEPPGDTGGGTGTGKGAVTRPSPPLRKEVTPFDPDATPFGSPRLGIGVSDEMMVGDEVGNTPNVITPDSVGYRGRTKSVGGTDDVVDDGLETSPGPDSHSQFL